MANEHHPAKQDSDVDLGTRGACLAWLESVRSDGDDAETQAGPSQTINPRTPPLRPSDPQSHSSDLAASEIELLKRLLRQQEITLEHEEEADMLEEQADALQKQLLELKAEYRASRKADRDLKRIEIELRRQKMQSERDTSCEPGVSVTTAQASDQNQVQPTSEALENPRRLKRKTASLGSIDTGATNQHLAQRDSKRRANSRLMAMISGEDEDAASQSTKAGKRPARRRMVIPESDESD